MQAGDTIGTGVSTRASWLPNLPLALLGIAVLACALLLTLPLTLPLGPMYWDLVLYLDAANRIGEGQVPLIDFIAPVGPLGYWLFAGLDTLFPRAHPLLTAQWCLFAVTAPAMAVILHAIGKQSRARALALLLPYLAFQILPINVEHYSFFPGTDGFGIYNRHVSIVLYVLVCGLVFLRGPALGAVIGWTLTALFLIKITGFLAGGIVTAFALAAGRIGWRQSSPDRGSGRAWADRTGTHHRSRQLLSRQHPRADRDQCRRHPAPLRPGHLAASRHRRRRGGARARAALAGPPRHRGGYPCATRTAVGDRLRPTARPRRRLARRRPRRRAVLRDAEHRRAGLHLHLAGAAYDPVTLARQRPARCAGRLLPRRGHRDPAGRNRASARRARPDGAGGLCRPAEPASRPARPGLAACRRHEPRGGDARHLRGPSRDLPGVHRPRDAAVAAALFGTRLPGVVADGGRRGRLGNSGA